MAEFDRAPGTQNGKTNLLSDNQPAQRPNQADNYLLRSRPLLTFEIFHNCGQAILEITFFLVSRLTGFCL